MEDEEFKTLIKRIIIGIVIALIFVVPLTFVFINKLTPHDSNIIKSIKNKEDSVVLIIGNDCSNCQTTIKTINNLEFKHFVINKDKNSTNYDKIITKLNMSFSDVAVPTILYLKEGNLKASLVEIKDNDDLLVFLKNYNIK